MRVVWRAAQQAVRAEGREGVGEGIEQTLRPPGGIDGDDQASAPAPFKIQAALPSWSRRSDSDARSRNDTAPPGVTGPM